MEMTDKELIKKAKEAAKELKRLKGLLAVVDQQIAKVSKGKL